MRYNVCFWGKVIPGQKRGRVIGFPTANMSLHRKLPEGIYISHATVGAKTYPAATFIGPARTYGEKEYKAETYILDFNQSLYGKWLTIRLIKKIRENKQFRSEQVLIKQIQEDIRKIKAYFKR